MKLSRTRRVKAQDATFQAREQFEKETKERRHELGELEKRVMQREANLDRKADLLDRKTEEAARKESQVVDREKELHRIQAEIEELKRQTQQELERVAGLSAEEAKKRLLAQLQEDVHAEAAAMTRRILEEAKQQADREAKRTITIAIERCASNHVATATNCTITLPSEEMKGRIIGREGRNIRAFEAATGINVLIDDTPQAVGAQWGLDPGSPTSLPDKHWNASSWTGALTPARYGPRKEVAKVREEPTGWGFIAKVGERMPGFVRAVKRCIPKPLTRVIWRLRFRAQFCPERAGSLGRSR